MAIMPSRARLYKAYSVVRPIQWKQKGGCHMWKKRAVYATAATVLLCGALIWQLALLGKNIVTAVTAAPVNDWGLGFGEAGTQPRGNCDAEYLKQFDSYFVGNAEEKSSI